MKAEINISRLKYLLDLYKLSPDELIDLISEGLKKTIPKEEIFTEYINLNFLKRIDKIFNKGLSFYVDPSDPVRSDNASIFFRKQEFNSDLNLKAKKIVNEFEELNLTLSAISKVTEHENPRVLPIYSVSDNPIKVASEIRIDIKYSFKKEQKAFLESLINKLGACNILVLEFIETWNQKERANIDGVFLSPNVIILKRLDGLSYRREIFTLAHELGHYLLNIEEIEKIDFDTWGEKRLSDVEKWCNSFAFHFLAGQYYSILNSLPLASANNDYNHEIVEEISQKTNLSELALYTQMLIDGRISPVNYNKVKHELNQRYKEFYDERKRIMEERRNNGEDIRGASPTPIKSEYLIDLVRTAYNDGMMNEYQVCKTLKIQPNKLGNYISI